MNNMPMTICNQPIDKVCRILKMINDDPYKCPEQTNYFHAVGLSIAQTQQLILDLLCERYIEPLALESINSLNRTDCFDVSFEGYNLIARYGRT